MRRTALILAALILLSGCDGIKITKPMLKMVVAASNKVSTEKFFADSCEKRLSLPYYEGGDPSQVMDIYYAPKEGRKDAVIIDIHGGFYVAGKRENNRSFASVFLREGYDVVLLEYRRNDGKLDVEDELSDCAAALDYLAIHTEELGLNKDRMFLTGDSAGGHLALYMAEGASDDSMPVRPKAFVPRGVMLNCPAYDYATFSNPEGFSKGALEWFIGPRYEDSEWMKSMSPRTFIGSYTGPLFFSTCTMDFIRSQSLVLKEDCDSLGREVEFVDIRSNDRKVGHVHNVTDQALPQSKEVSSRMVSFMDRNL